MNIYYVLGTIFSALFIHLSICPLNKCLCVSSMCQETEITVVGKSRWSYWPYETCIPVRKGRQQRN